MNELFLRCKSLHNQIVVGNFKEINHLELCHIVETPSMIGLEPANGSSCSNAEIDKATRLVTVTILSYLLERVSVIEDQNPDVYTLCQRLLTDESFFIVLVENIKSEDCFLTHVSSKCLGSLLKEINDQGTREKRFQLLLEACLSNESKQLQNKFYSIFAHILSQKNSALDAKRTLVQMLQAHWEQLLNKTFPILDSDGDQTSQAHCSFSLMQMMPFLTLWKKIVKCEMIHDTFCASGTNTVLGLLQDKPTLLLELLEVRPDHLIIRKVLDILITALGSYDFIGRKQEQCCPLGLEFLHRLDAALGTLPISFSSVGFGGSVRSEAGTRDGRSCDTVLTRKMCLAVLKAAAVLTQSDDHGVIVDSLGTLELYLQKILQEPNINMKELLFQLFAEQDDGLIAVLFLSVLIHQQLRQGSDTKTTAVINSIQPHEMFLDFLENVSFDHSILLDLLTSPETCFLAYLTKYLQVLSADWDRFREVTRQYSDKLMRSESDWSAEVCDTESAAASGFNTDDELLGDSTDSPFLAVTSERKDNEPLKESDSNIAGSCEKSRTVVPDDENKSKISGPAETFLENASSNLVAYSCSEESDLDEPDIDNSSDLCLKKMHLCDKVSDEKLVAKGQSLNSMQNEVQQSDTITEFKIPCSGSLKTSNGGDDRCKDEDEGMDDLTNISQENIDAGDSIYKKDDILDQAMAALIRLRMAIQRLHSNGLFPYNPTVLINLIEACEDLYEK